MTSGLSKAYGIAGVRIGWSAGGEALLVGANPKRAADDEGSSQWIAVNLRGSHVSGAGDAPTPVAWTTGPTLDVSVPVDFVSAHTIAAGPRSIESGDGWIRVREGAATRVVGPGTALVATATGRFIAALAPNAPGKAGAPAEQPARLVVYDLGR